MFGNAMSTLGILVVMTILIIGSIYMGVAGKFLHEKYIDVIDDDNIMWLKTTYILIFLGTALLGLGAVLTLIVPIFILMQRGFIVKVLSIAEGLAYLAGCLAYSCAAYFAFKARSDKAEFDDLWRQLNTLGVFSIIFAVLALMVGGYAISYKRMEAEDESD